MSRDLATGLRIVTVDFDDPDAAKMVGESQRENAARYGTEDETPVAGHEFAPPHGDFFVGYLDGTPAACAGWRRHGDDAELKRMYVAPSARRKGIAAALLAEVERSAAAAGRTMVILETGQRQPEAIALYRRFGYEPVGAFGYYAGEPEALHLGKPLAG